MPLRIGESPFFGPPKTFGSTLTVGGQILAADGSAAAPSYAFNNDRDTGFYSAIDADVRFAANGVACIDFSAQGINLATNGLFWGSAINVADLKLFRDAANVLALRNGTNAQQFNVYNTYTDASNYSRLEIGAGGNPTIQTIGLGTGATQNLIIGPANGGATLFFQAGGSLRWQVTGGGHFVAQTDNASDIGQNGANRPRNIYVGTNVTVGGQILAAAGTIGAPGYSFTADPTTGFYRTGPAGETRYSASGVGGLLIDVDGIQLPATGRIGFSSGTVGVGTDVFLRRDAANVLALRNGTNAQRFNIYETYTDASNYSLLAFKYDSGASRFLIQPENLGTGTARPLGLGAGGSCWWEITTLGYLRATANVNIWNGTSALATTATAGFLGVNSCAGPPTGVPANIPTGQIPLVYDSTNDKLYIYRSGWKTLAAAFA